MNIDWQNLPFGYVKTDYNVRCYFRNGEWGEIETSSSEHIEIHMAASSLHYGQEAFEGLKAYRCKDGKIRIFRPEANAERLQSTCRGIMMPELPTEKFVEMCKKVIKLNERFIPPYGTGASLYLRPLLIGTGITVGVKPADEYLFVIFVTPVGPYFKGGFKANPYVITRKYDRSAPLGTGILTMPLPSKPTSRPATVVSMPASSISTPRRRSMSTRPALPTSSASRTVPTSPRRALPSCPPSPTRASCSSPRIWA